MVIRRREHSVPNLNLASMPDLIFTVLFFFMIVTHMRNVTPRVSYQTPQGTELAKLAGRQAILYIYIGENNSKQSIQINNQLVAPAQLAATISAEKARFSASERRQLIAMIKADRHVPVEVIKQVKQSLREANITRVSYAATQKAPTNKQISN